MSKKGCFFFLAIGVIGSAGCASGQSAASEPSLSAVPGSAIVLNGARNTRVEMVALSPGSEAEVLIRITGTGNEIDGRVLPYTLDEWSDRRHTYETQVHGYSRYYIHINRPGGRADNEFLELAVPDKRDEFYKLEEDKKAELDVEEFLLTYENSKADGSYQKFAAFDRQRDIQRTEESLAKSIESMNEACGSSRTMSIDWPTIDDESLKTLSISSFCSEATEAVTELCTDSRKTAAKWLTLFDDLRCEYAPMATRLDERTLVFSFDSESDSRAEENVKEFVAGMEHPNETMGFSELVQLENTQLCTDGNGNYVGIRPKLSESGDVVIYGDGNEMIETKDFGYIGSGQFFDPREMEPNSNPNFRGIDYRFISSVSIDEEENTCQLRCGERKIPLQTMANEDIEALLLEAEFKPNPKTRRPFAVARDRKKRYYLVETGIEPDSVDFKIYAGPRGRLKPLKMTNVINDSEGMIFTTRSGTLRLIIESDQSFWTVGKRTRKLVNVPIRENTTLVYTGLGVYLGQPFGTPCDTL